MNGASNAANIGLQDLTPFEFDVPLAGNWKQATLLGKSGCMYH